MHVTETVVIGGGQAGLAASYHLTARGRDHVVLERGRVGQRWRAGVWDSLRLLSPNWLNTLPGWGYRGTDPDGFASATEFADSLGRYAVSFAAPVVEGAGVRALISHNGGFEVATPVGLWWARNVILATGWSDLPLVPTLADDLPRHVRQLTAHEYRNPGSVAEGGVLVVGASATGIQLADELLAAGREVTIAVGRHRRMPRMYRGRDIFWWLMRIGLLDTAIDDVADANEAPFEPSLQVVGRPDRRTVDLAGLQARGARLVGRVAAADGQRVHLAPGLPETLRDADARLERLLRDIDRHIDAAGLHVESVAAASPQVAVPEPSTTLDLRRAGIRTIVWATGHRRAYPWLRLPVLDERGEIRQRHGITPVPGLFVLGYRFQSYRSSNWVCGVGRDAAAITALITGEGRSGSPAWSRREVRRDRCA